MTQICSMVPAIIEILNQYQVAYTPLDIDQDTPARTELQSITGGDLCVPTIVLPDGTTLIEPTVVELEIALAEAGLIETKEFEDTELTWSKMIRVFTGVLLSLLVFVVTVVIGQHMELTFNMGWLIAGGMWIMVGSMIVGRLPVIRNQLTTLRGVLRHPPFQLLQMLVYCGLIGLIASQSSHDKPIFIWVAIIAILLPIGLLLSRLIGQEAQDHQHTVQLWQKRLSWVTLVGFVVIGLLTISLNNHLATIVALSYIPTLGMTFVVSCLSLWTQQQAISLIKGLTYPAMSLILLLLFV